MATPPRSERPDLASLLVARKVATASKIEQARRAHASQPLWSAVLDDGIITDEALFALLRDHSGMPVAPEVLLARSVPLERLSPILSRDQAMAAGFLPLELSADGRRVQVAMIDPSDEKTLRSVAQSAGLQSAKVFLVARGTFVAAVERSYAAPRTDVAPAGKVGQRSDAEAAERLEQVLVQATVSLGSALEAELGRGSQVPSPREAGRLAREVARELGHDRRRVALAGLAAQLVQLDELRRGRRDHEQSLFDELGWAAGGDDGLLGISRALTSQAAGFSPPQQGGASQRVVQAVIDYLGLIGEGGAASESAGLDSMGQLLRASSAGAPVIDALVRVLRRELADRTPHVATALPESSSGITNVRGVRRDLQRDSQRDPARARANDERTQLLPLPARPRGSK